MKLQIKLIQPQFINKALGPCLAMVMHAGVLQTDKQPSVSELLGVGYEGLYSKLSLPPVLGVFRHLRRSFKQLRGSRLVNSAIAKSEGVMKGQAQLTSLVFSMVSGGDFSQVYNENIQMYSTITLSSPSPSTAITSYDVAV